MEHSLVKRPMIYGDFFEEIAENTLEWEPVSVDNKQLTTITAINWDSGIHKVSPNFESDVKLISVV